MEHFELFEKVTARVSLKTGRVLETALKDACRKTGAEYHEAADIILISGTLAQVSETQEVIKSKFRKQGRSSSSSDFSEVAVASKHGRATYDTSPSTAKYIKSFCADNLKEIELSCKVKITWSKDCSKVEIKAESAANLFTSACDQFADMYKHYHQAITKISFDMKSQSSAAFRKKLETVLHNAPRYTSGLILQISADGSTYILWGTTSSLKQARHWMNKQLDVALERPRSVSPQSAKGPPKDALTHETNNKLKVIVYHGDITKENADIIVNACNKHLDHAGGVSYAISKAGGPTVQQDSDDFVSKHGALKTGNVAVTGPGFLSCKYIVHAVGPQWNVHGKEKSLKLFFKVFMNVYKEAVQRGARSIAMPAISSGIYGVPKDVCAQAVFSFVDEIDQILASDPSARPFEIRLVNIDEEIVKAISQEFTKWQLKGKKVERRHSFDAVKNEVKVRPGETRSLDDMHKTPRIKASLLTFNPKHPDDHSTAKPNSPGFSVASKNEYRPSSTSPSSVSPSSREKTATAKTSREPSSGSSSYSKAALGIDQSKSSDVYSTQISVSSPRTSVAPAFSKMPADDHLGVGSPFYNQTTNTSHSYTADPRNASTSVKSPNAVTAHLATVPSSSQQGAPPSTKQETSSSKAAVTYNQNSVDRAHCKGNESGDCSICQCSFTDPISLPKCGHTFCKSCIERAFSYQKKCPVCLEVYGITEGDQPDGTMEYHFINHSLPGYEGHGCYVITYVIPDGVQDNRHPKPGQRFTGTSRRAFLPATKEGEVVLKLLRKAFDKKLVFTVGRSSTTGKENCVTWNDIHHKTSFNGGPSNFGYPDPGYMNRVKDELKAKGIVP